MASCLPIAPLNPVNELMLSIFGPNFFPTFNAGFQPIDRSQLTNEKLLKMQLPANAIIKPIGDPKQTHIGGYISGLIGQLGPIFSIFGVLFLILDLIRGIVDIFCSFPNIEAMILAILELFATLLPPIVALFPPLSTLLLILNVIKMIVAIVVSLVAALIPLMDLIVENAQSISFLLESGDLGAVSTVTIKLCELFQLFGNELGAFDPISFIIEMITFFSSLSSKFFCASDSTCCDQCPSVITTPLSGTATIVATSTGSKLGDFIPGLPSSIANTPLGSTTITIKDNTKNLGDYQPYVIDPASLPKSGSTESATIRVQVNSSLLDAQSASESNQTITLLVANSSIYTVGHTVSYTVVPDTTQLLQSNLISMGCLNEIRAASDGLKNQFPANAFDSVRTKAGDMPPPDSLRQALQGILDAQQADPTTDRTQQVLNAAGSYLADLTDYYATIICTASNRFKSDFNVSTNFAIADGASFATLEFIVKDANGVPLLADGLPNANDKFSVIFQTTFGSVGPVLFDSTTGAFRASLTSDEVGKSEISAIFVVNGKECMRAGVINNNIVSDKINIVDFISAGGNYARKRQQRQYVQSRGGRRR